MALKLLFKGICWNLEMISSLANNQTCYVVDSKLFIENRFCTMWKREARTRGLIVDALQHTWDSISEMLTAYQNSNFLLPSMYYAGLELNACSDILQQLTELCSKETKVELGLKCLATYPSYNLDTAFQLSINELISDFKKLCARAQSLQSRHVRIKTEVNDVLHKVNDVSVLKPDFVTSLDTCEA